jgi:hypothetical protein
VTKLKKYLKDKYKLNSTQWTIVGIRGFDYVDGKFVQNSDEIDQFNDTVLIMKGTEVRAYRATLDPGLTWILRPMAGILGAARLEEGCYMYQRGKHKGHDAFIQAGKVTIRRDKNKDKKWTMDEEQESGFFGIHIHARFSAGKVGSNSAGCTVIDSLWDQKPWNEFKTLLYSSNQTLYPYAVINQETFKELC